MDVVKAAALVERFHREITGQPLPDKPTRLSDDRFNYALTHLYEEYSEFGDAHEKGDLDGAADALLDLIYVAIGRLLEMGYSTSNALFENVHEKNMQKVPGKVAKRDNAAFDTVKPEGWTPPDAQAALLSLNEVRQLMGLRDYLKDTRSWYVTDLQGKTHQIVLSSADTLTFDGLTCSIMEPGHADPSFRTGEDTGKPTEIVMPRNTSYEFKSQSIGGLPPKTVKQTAGKIPVELVPYEFVMQVGEIFGFGAGKYTANGYKITPPTVREVLGAGLRHTFDLMRGKDYDVNDQGRHDELDARGYPKYSGLHQLGHIGCCFAMASWILKNRPDRDDRYKGPGSFGYDLDMWGYRDAWAKLVEAGDAE